MQQISFLGYQSLYIVEGIVFYYLPSLVAPLNYFLGQIRQFC